MAIFDQAFGKGAQNRARQNYLQQIEKMVPKGGEGGSAVAADMPAPKMATPDRPLSPTKVFGRRG